jgi:acylphosphatase
VEEVKHLKVSVSGLVQGVFFRASTKEKAEQLGLKGYVMNESDGSVLIHAQGESNSLTALLSWCESGGPEGAIVDKVEVNEVGLEPFEFFRIRR